MSDTKKPHGGPGRGQGRKPLVDGPKQSFQVRLSQEQREKLRRLGGAKWIRKKIDQEPEK